MPHFRYATVSYRKYPGSIPPASWGFPRQPKVRCPLIGRSGCRHRTFVHSRSDSLHAGRSSTGFRVGPLQTARAKCRNRGHGSARPALVQGVQPVLPALLPLGGVLFPPGSAAFTQGDLGRMHAPSGDAFRLSVVGAAGGTHGASGPHQHAAQPGGRVLRNVGIGGPPAAAVDHDEVPVRSAVRLSHPRARAPRS